MTAHPGPRRSVRHPLNNASTLLPLAITVALAACAAPPVSLPNECVPPQSWVRPATGRTLVSDALLADGVSATAVLLGETHDNPAHHQWQLDTLRALYQRRPGLVLGLEMFPRRLQPVLDRWTAGGFGDDAAFLDAVEWHRVWGFDAALYLPLFRFARDHRLPLIALNVDRELLRRVSRAGWATLPAADRQGIGDPAAPPPPYVESLRRSFAGHGGNDPAGTEAAFRRFLDAQLLWDRAMAEAIQAAAQRPDRPLVVALTGAGHLADRAGVPHQLAALGVGNVRVWLPWDAGRSCAELTAGLSDAVYGLPPSPGGPP